MKNRKNRTGIYLSLALSAVLAAADTLPAAAAEYPYSQYISGENAQNLPESEAGYTIVSLSTEADLLQLAQDCQLDSWSRDKYIRLENDITLGENTNVIIPSFGGIFEGNGHTISGLQITSSGSALGLFRYIQASGTVRSLTVSGNVLPTGNGSRYGILAGVNYGKILNCSVSGKVAGAEETGGICGINESSGELRRCHSSATVTGEHYTGGICGINKGTLNNCTNTGNINAHSTDVAYGLEDITLENLQDLNSTENMAAHTDTGGITGYSEGKIYYCSNSGTVGYQHVGYNTGGIAGRLHQGYIQNCTNTGRVLGRKDVGGIVGQMEPFLEIQYLNDKLSEIDREAELFFDLLEAAGDDLQRYGGEASALAGEISTHLTNASSAAGNLMGTGNELWYLFNQELTGINNDLSRLNQEIADQAAADRDQADTGSDAPSSEEGQLEPTGEQYGNTNGNSNEENIPDNTHTGSDSATENVPDSDHAGGDNTTGNMPDNIEKNEDSSADITDTDHPQITVNGNEITFPDNPFNGNTSWPTPDTGLESYIAALRRFGESAGAHIANITNATSDRSGGINDNLNTLNNELHTAGSQLQQLADVLEQGNDKTSVNIDALLNQARVLRRSVRELRDELFRYEGISIEDASDETAASTLPAPGISDDGTGSVPFSQNPSGQDTGDGSSPANSSGNASGDNSNNVDSPDSDSGKDAATESPGAPAAASTEQTEETYYDTTSFQQGKITLCVNTGSVEADTNVGGIAGQIATEYDFDPEDDITLTGTESFNLEQTVKAVIRESRNQGNITAKKDYVGGIVGKADHGAVISCESYGSVSASGGSYAGGIAGFSGYSIRNCYFMGSLSGKNFVGGIVGKGSDVFYSYAYPELEYSGEYAGSIAGQLEENGTLCGNYYVQGTLPGVDSIGYEGGATPLDYKTFCSSEVVPDAFRDFTICFQADGAQLASFQCRYGESLDRSLIPEIPEKEGYYGTWPEFNCEYITRSQVLEAKYEKWISTLAGSETSQNGRPLVLVQGEFLPENRLLTETLPEGTRLSVVSADEDGNVVTGQYEKPVLVRALYEDSEISADKAVVELWNGENYVQLPAKTVGSYLEFTLEQPGIFRITVPQDNHAGTILLIAGCAGILAAFLLVFRIIRKRTSAGHKTDRMEPHSVV